MTREQIRSKMFRVVEQWTASGVTQKDWCKKNRVAYSSFHYWFRKYRDCNAVTSSAGDDFVELLVDDRQMSSPWGELIFPDGKRLVFHRQIDVDFLRTLTA